MDGSRAQEPPLEHLLVGQIASAHGLRGEVSVKVLSEQEDRFAPGAGLLVGSEPGRTRPMEIEGFRQHSGRALVKFSGIEDRSSAESLRGSLIFIEKSRIAELEADAYWEHELVGARVVDLQGAELGTLTGIDERIEQDIWRVQTASGEVLVPAAKDIIASVEMESRRIVVDPPEGLFPDQPNSRRP